MYKSQIITSLNMKCIIYVNVKRKIIILRTLKILNLSLILIIHTCTNVIDKKNIIIYIIISYSFFILFFLSVSVRQSINKIFILFYFKCLFCNLCLSFSLWTGRACNISPKKLSRTSSIPITIFQEWERGLQHPMPTPCPAYF